MRLLAVDRLDVVRTALHLRPRRRRSTTRTVTFGFAAGRDGGLGHASGAGGGGYYHPLLLGRLRLLRVGQRQRLWTLGQHRLPPARARGTPAAASLARRPAACMPTRAPARPAATAPAGTTPGPAMQPVATTAPSTRRRWVGNVARAQHLAQHRPQRSYGSERLVHGAGGVPVDRTTATTAGPQAGRGARRRPTNAKKTGETNTWTNGGLSSNDTFADANGNLARSDGSGGWQGQHSSSGWGRSLRATAHG